MKKVNLKTLIYQFKITLLDIEPMIWRRVQVPETYSFWDLHVAIQDAMGWLDYHLHDFRIRAKHKNKSTLIGIPDDDLNAIILPGWKVKIQDYFVEPGQTAFYEYDFGDNWEHELLFEGFLIKDKAIKYPQCIAGERACPPEDCGGVPGYYDLLEILNNPKHEEHKEMIDWLKGHAKNYYPYNPDEFHPDKVHFTNPKKRLNKAFPETDGEQNET